MRTPILFLFLLLATIAVALPAQVVTVANQSPFPWSGYVRTTVDVRPQHPTGWLLGQHRTAGEIDNPTVAIYRTGRRIGESTWILDIRCDLAVGQQRTFDLSTFTDCEIPVPAMPADPVGVFGGPLPTVNGAFMTLLSLQVDGAAFLAHLRARVPDTRMLVCDLWLWWMPEQPAFAQGEALVTCSNPAVPDMTETTAQPVWIGFGDAKVAVLGATEGGVVVPKGTSFADGQARAVPLCFVWRRNFPKDLDGWIAAWCNAECAKTWHVSGSGISQPLVDGAPRREPSFNAAAWAAGTITSTLGRIHDWRGGTTGPSTRSGDTGAQPGDQVFVGFESPTTGLIRYLGALKMAARPCHHREADGAPLDPVLHPNLRIWDGRAHWHTGVSPDQLGKPRSLDFASGETSGWWGPDVEHDFFNTLACAARVTGSPCCQELLRAQATVYRLQWTYAPLSASTSQAYAARAVGWESILAVHLWRELEDRALAATVRAHWLNRWALVLKPFFERQRIQFPTGWFMDCRENDPRLGAGWWWIPWQQGVGAYGLDIAGRVFGVAEASEWALHFAEQIVKDGYVPAGDRWQASANHTVAEGECPHDESFNYFGMSLGPAVVVRYQPQHPKARAVWDWLKAQLAAPGQASWMAPGVQ